VGPEVLSQSEIDALLKALSSGTLDVSSLVGEEREGAVKLYDFKRPDKFNKDQLRAIQMIHEFFARQLTTTFSSFVRAMVSVEVASVEQLSYDEFVRSLVQPTVIVVMEMYPLSSNALLEINPRLVFAIMDRMLGGPGKSIYKPRELTDIERTVTERVVMRMLELLEESWSTIVDLRFRIQNMESNPYFAQICPASDVVVVVTLQVKLGEVDGFINLCIPYFAIEPIVDRLSSQQWFVSTSSREDDASKEHLTKRLMKVRVPLSVEIGHVDLILEDLLKLQVGDVIKLEESCFQPVKVRIGGRVKYLAQAGVHNKRYSIKIIKPFSLEDEDIGLQSEEELMYDR
jgi:flagellar motor switch protein FliM